MIRFGIQRSSTLAARNLAVSDNIVVNKTSERENRGTFPSDSHECILRPFSPSHLSLLPPPRLILSVISLPRPSPRLLLRVRQLMTYPGPLRVRMRAPPWELPTLASPTPQKYLKIKHTSSFSNTRKLTAREKSLAPSTGRPLLLTLENSLEGVPVTSGL